MTKVEKIGEVVYMGMTERLHTNIGIERGLSEKTVTIYKSVTCAFLLYMHNLGYRFFKDISEEDILEYFSTSKVGADQCRYIKSVLSDCSNLIESESVERVITLMPQMPRVQKVIDFLTKHEIEAIKNVILSDDGKMPLRDKAICALAMFTELLLYGTKAA